MAVKKREKVGLPLKVVTGTCVTSVYNLLGESSSSFLFRARRTRTRYGTCLQHIISNRNTSLAAVTLIY